MQQSNQEQMRCFMMSLALRSEDNIHNRQDHPRTKQTVSDKSLLSKEKSCDKEGKSQTGNGSQTVGTAILSEKKDQDSQNNQSRDGDEDINL